jgi:hypothetical protein
MCLPHVYMMRIEMYVSALWGQSVFHSYETYCDHSIVVMINNVFRPACTKFYKTSFQPIAGCSGACLSSQTIQEL